VEALKAAKEEGAEKEREVLTVRSVEEVAEEEKEELEFARGVLRDLKWAYGAAGRADAGEPPSDGARYMLGEIRGGTAAGGKLMDLLFKIVPKKVMDEEMGVLDDGRLLDGLIERQLRPLAGLCLAGGIRAAGAGAEGPAGQPAVAPGAAEDRAGESPEW
jgi:hypothetical protein